LQQEKRSVTDRGQTSIICRTSRDVEAKLTNLYSSSRQQVNFYILVANSGPYVVRQTRIQSLLGKRNARSFTSLYWDQL